MDLNKLRKKIDDLDHKIIDLLNERTKVAVNIGEAKSKLGKEIYAPERESQIYRKLEEMGGAGPLPKDALKAIYREIMSASLSLEKQMRIAYLGPEASFTHLASLSKFGSQVEYFPTPSINAVFREVELKQADYGVVPIENSIEGAVNHTLDMFFESEAKICSEILFEINHNLMSNSDIKHVKRIYSNPQVFGQCRQWLATHVPYADLIDSSSTTAAAQKAAKEDGAAAIGSKLAANLYNIPVLASGIQDFSKNVTRFLVISPQIAGPTKKDKTSILVSVRDKVGALYDMLLPFKKHSVNMTKIESRPSKKKAWDYYFFIDFEGHVEQPRVKKMIAAIERKVKFLRVLGSYPASVKKEI